MLQFPPAESRVTPAQLPMLVFVWRCRVVPISAQHVLTTRQWCCDTQPQQPPHRCGGHAGKLQSNPTIQPRAEHCLIVNASEKLLKKEKFVFIIQNSFHLRAEIVKFSINRISPASTSTGPASSDYILLNKRTKETETCDPELGYKHTTVVL